jgi:hypothetical protein
MMILLEFPDGYRALFTGDLLCPLLREEDWLRLRDFEQVDVICVDANTRFPWPRSGHWSIVANDPGKTGMSSELTKWTQRERPSYLVTPHAQNFDERTYHYFDQFLSETYNRQTACCWSIFEFVERVKPRRVQLVHYSGYEDNKHRRQEIMTDDALLAWTKGEWAREVWARAIPSELEISWEVPKPGKLIYP